MTEDIRDSNTSRQNFFNTCTQHSHQDLTKTTNPEGNTEAEQELYALAGSMDGTKKLDEVK